MIIEKPIQIGMLIACITASVHTTLTTNASDFYHLIPYAFGVYIFGALLNWSDCMQTVRDIGDEYTVEEFKAGLVPMAIIIPVLIFLIFSFYVSLRDVYLWAHSPVIEGYQTALLTGVITTSLAYMLFIFRLNKRTLYGFTEMLVGLMVAEHHAFSIYNQKNPDPEILLAILTAGIYLMVRGLDNMHQGMSKNETMASQLRKDIGFQPGESNDG